MNRLVLAFPLMVVACGGGDKSPAAPSATTTGLTVTVSSPVRMGQTTQAAATETLANGQTRPITTGWVSDAPAVATVSDTLSQSPEQVSAVVDYGASWVFPAIAALIREDGVTGFAPTLSVTESGVTLTIEAAFNINSTRVGELTGTVNEVWRVPNVSGEARLTQEIIGTTRTSTTALSTGSESQGRRHRLFRKIVDHDH